MVTVRNRRLPGFDALRRPVGFGLLVVSTDVAGGRTAPAGSFCSITGSRAGHWFSCVFRSHWPSVPEIADHCASAEHFAGVGQWPVTTLCCPWRTAALGMAGRRFKHLVT